MLSGSSHLVGCRLSGCCRRSLLEKCQSRNERREVCGPVRDRLASSARKDFPAADCRDCAVPGLAGFTSHAFGSPPADKHSCHTVGVLIRSQLFVVCRSNADIPADSDTNPSNTALDRPTSRLEGMGYMHHMCTKRSSLPSRPINVYPKLVHCHCSWPLAHWKSLRNDTSADSPGW